MKKKPLTSKPLNSSKLAFDDLYDDISKNWELKSKHLQDRRWRILKRAMKEGGRYERNY